MGAQQYNPLNCDYEISLEPNSVIEECPEDASSKSIPSQIYKVGSAPASLIVCNQSSALLSESWVPLGSACILQSGLSP